MTAPVERRLSTIARPIDLHEPTNLVAIVLTLGAFLGTATARWGLGAEWALALIEGLHVAGAVFLAWALGRENDPDRQASAFLAAAGGFASAVLLGSPGFLLLVWFLIATRIVNRTTGVPAGVLDVAGLCGVAVWLGVIAHWTVPLLALAPALFAEGRRSPMAVRVALAGALTVAAIALGVARGWRFDVPAWRTIETSIPAAIALGLVPVVFAYRRVQSVGDRTGAPLEPARVRWALGWGFAAATILTLAGAATIRDAGPLWAAFAGAILGWAIQKLDRRAAAIR